MQYHDTKFKTAQPLSSQLEGFKNYGILSEDNFDTIMELYESGYCKVEKTGFFYKLVGFEICQSLDFVFSFRLQRIVSIPELEPEVVSFSVDDYRQSQFNTVKAFDNEFIVSYLESLIKKDTFWIDKRGTVASLKDVILCKSDYTRSHVNLRASDDSSEGWSGKISIINFLKSYRQIGYGTLKELNPTEIRENSEKYFSAAHPVLFPPQVIIEDFGVEQGVDYKLGVGSVFYNYSDMKAVIITKDNDHTLDLMDLEGRNHNHGVDKLSFMSDYEKIADNLKLVVDDYVNIRTILIPNSQDSRE